jgi:hypothetical protein
MKYGLDDIDGYFDVNDQKSCLDGYFTAAELRRIADKMDELKPAEPPPRDPSKCRYCDNAPTKRLIWLKDKYGKPARIAVNWCGCDLQEALKRFWTSPYPVREGIDYEVQELVCDTPL